MEARRKPLKYRLPPKGVLKVESLNDFVKFMGRALNFNVNFDSATSQVRADGSTYVTGAGGEGGPGPKGPDGPSGPTGPPGSAGSNGMPGTPGGNGASPVAPIGPDGDPGEMGDQGPKGPPETEPGPKGPKGDAGPPGDDMLGPRGAPGPIGEPNIDPGPDGPPGPPGPPGTPAFEPGSPGPPGDPGGPGFTFPGLPGDEGPPGAKGEPGNKYAIVTIPDGRHLGLHATEASRPWFMDEITFKIPPLLAYIDLPIDAVYLGTIEPASLCVIQTSTPAIGAQIMRDRVRITVSAFRLSSITGVVTLAGIRAGFLDWHFKSFTAEQMTRNNAFYSAAYG